MSSATASKRQKTNKIVHVSDFHMTDCTLHTLVKSNKCNLVPLTFASDRKSPVLVQLSGGGRIPGSFGIDDKEMDGRRKVNLSFQIDDETEHEHLTRLRTEFIGMVGPVWDSWFPGQTTPSAEVLESFCTKLVGDRKKKSGGGEGTWAGLGKAAIEPADCETNRCKIVHAETGDKIAFADVPGMTWSKIVLEFKYVYVQATRKYGITKKLRYMSCTPDEDDCDIEPL